MLRNRSVILRALEPDDLKAVFTWRNELDYLQLFAHNPAIISYDDFLLEQKRLSVGRHLQFAVEIERGSKIIGVLYTYDFDRIHGHMFIGGYMSKPFRGLGYGAVGLALLISYLFKSFPVHKVYLDVVSNNSPSLRMLKKFGFGEEGRFKEHHYDDGHRYDMVRFAAYRDCLTKVRSLLKL
jgi:RimJ/RimL family protein N-acetyltransferase